MSSIDKHSFKNQRALIRVDFNVPLDEHKNITDDTRIQAALPTIKKVLKDGGAVIIMTHLGRPKEKLQSVSLGAEDEFSTRHLLPYLSEELGTEVQFADDAGSEDAYKKAMKLKKGDVLLLENTRFYQDETDGDDDFAQMLSTLGDIYINDAFGTAHRAHASTAVVANYFPSNKKMFGYLMQSEIDNAEKIMKNPKKPFTAIIGGAKVSDKIMILENLLERADHIIIGGGMAYTFIKSQGGQIGKSLVEDDKLELAKKIMKQAEEKNVHIHLPSDSIIADAFSNDANTKTVASDQIPDGWMGLDIGPDARISFEEVIATSKTILWNGPMGVFEMSTFSQGTESIAKSVAKATQKGAFSLIGGGDSVAAINKTGLQEDVSFISTGGGAILEFFEGKELPGIKSIRGKSQNN